jgi:hypothetical protein
MATRKRRNGKDAGTGNPHYLLGTDIDRAATRIFAGLRAQHRFTQRQVSDRLGKRPSWTNLLENGHYSIKLQDFVDLCRLYQKDPVEIMEQIMHWQPMDD